LTNLRAGVVAATIVLASTGCAPDSSPGAAWTVAVDTTPNGVIRVVNSPPASGIEPTWVIEPELRIGVVEGNRPDAFGQIRCIAPLPDGRIAVLDAQAQEIRIFGPDGEHLRTFGGRGGGPGELRNANGMLVGPDGLLRVNDPANARLSFFHADDGFVRSERLHVYSWGFLWNATMDANGRVYEPTLAMLGDERWNAIKVYDETGVWLDTIKQSRYEQTPPERQPDAFYYDAGNVRGFIAVPFYPSGATSLDPRGFFWVKGSGDNDYRFARTTFTGDTTLIVVSRRSALPVSAAERDSAIAAIRERVPGHQFDWRRIPAEKPIVQGMHLDDAGRLWVRLFASDTATTYDVFSADGRYVGTAIATLSVPSFWQPVIVGDWFYTLHTDELGVEYVVRARVRPLGGDG